MAHETTLVKFHKGFRSVTTAFARLLPPLNQLNLVAFRRVDEGEDAAGGGRGGAVGVFQAESREVFAEFFEVVHLEGQVRQVRLHLHRTARRETAQFNLFLALRRFEEDQFRAARGFVPAHFLQAQHVLVKLHGLLEIVHAVACVQQFSRFHRERSITRPKTNLNLVTHSREPISCSFALFMDKMFRADKSACRTGPVCATTTSVSWRRQRSWLLFLVCLGASATAHAQIDPERRRLVQLGYNQPIQGRGPLSGYAFYYFNEPGFIQTN